MKKIKCEKCGLYYRDRGEEDFKTGSGYVRSLCWNCGFLWKTLGIIINSLGEYARTRNRDIVIELSKVSIRRLRK